MKKTIKNFYKYFEQYYQECKNHEDEEIRADAAWVYNNPIAAREHAIHERQSAIRWIDSAIEKAEKDENPPVISIKALSNIKKRDLEEIAILEKELAELRKK